MKFNKWNYHLDKISPAGEMKEYIYKQTNQQFWDYLIKGSITIRIQGSDVMTEQSSYPFKIVVYICMKRAWGISLYLYLKLAKMPCFSYCLLCVFFYKIGEQEGRTGSAPAGDEVGDWYKWEGEKGRRMNTVQIRYTHVSKCKNDTCCNCSRNPGRGDERESSGGCEFKYDIFDTL
jgi:hypothetical protein